MTLTEIIAKLKSCNFTCEAGVLENNTAFQALEKLVFSETLTSDYTCPCILADKPCMKHCTCASPMQSHGCLACATYGSDEQRKEKANFIVNRVK